jgi:hypothetical protein
MTKTTKAAAGKPATIEINELTEMAFAQAAVLIRSGYQFSRFTPPQTFMHGQSSITLVLGDPDARATADAAASQSLALARQIAREQREDLEALAQTQAEQERQAIKAELAKEVTEAKSRLKQLEAAQQTA